MEFRIRDRSISSLLLVLLAPACQPLVLSGYGSKLGVNNGPNADEHYRGGLAFRPERHDGVDIRAGHGSPVLASADGVIRSVDFGSSYGFDVSIEHVGFGVWTHYVHLQSVGVNPGERVRRGQVIGKVGLFPLSAGVVHVHWMLCTSSRCGGYGPAGHTADPMAITAGCFEAGYYARDRLVLTYPVKC
jgi:murein DD-endopeptidase MepM/ murein hydrolase activator NlpD